MYERPKDALEKDVSFPSDVSVDALDNIVNDFTASNGTILDTTSYASVSQKYENIFFNFGQTWMVRERESSLFKSLSASHDFSMFHFPNYVPSFEYFGGIASEVTMLGIAT